MVWPISNQVKEFVKQQCQRHDWCSSQLPLISAKWVPGPFLGWRQPSYSCTKRWWYVDSPSVKGFRQLHWSDNWTAEIPPYCHLGHIGQYFYEVIWNGNMVGKVVSLPINFELPWTHTYLATVKVMALKMANLIWLQFIATAGTIQLRGKENKWQCFHLNKSDGEAFWNRLYRRPRVAMGTNHHTPDMKVDLPAF